MPRKASSMCVTNGAREETTGGGGMGGASGQHLARLGWGRGERGGAEGGRGVAEARKGRVSGGRYGGGCPVPRRRAQGR